jgi:hypothetical protein
VARYAALFNQRDWDGLRALLADDVKLNQSTHPVRVGSADVGMFFSIYAKIDGVWLAPAWLEGREVIAVFENRLDTKPSYFMWLEWRGNEITFSAAGPGYISAHPACLSELSVNPRQSTPMVVIFALPAAAAS